MMEKQRTNKPLIAGILILVSEGLAIITPLGFFILTIFILIVGYNVPWDPLAAIIVIIICVLAITALGIVGGIYSIKRKRWGLALTGAIMAVFPFVMLGLAAIVLLALSKNEFK